MYAFVTDHFPLLIARVGGTLTDADFAKMEESIRWTRARDAPYVSLYLARESERPSATMRARLAEIAGGGRGRCEANAIIVSNVVVAGALKAIRWVQPAPYPERAFTSTVEAVAWLSEMARATQIVLPENAHDLVVQFDGALARQA